MPKQVFWLHKAHRSPAGLQAEVAGLNYLSPPGQGSAAKEVERSTQPEIVISAYPMHDFDAWDACSHARQRAAVV